MSKILVLAEHGNGELAAATAKTVSCAAAIAEHNQGSIDVVVFAAGDAAAALAQQAAALQGVARVLCCQHDDFAHPLAAHLAPELAALAGDYSHILAPSSMYGKDVLPRAAALIGVNQVSEVMAVLGEREFKRPLYAGAAIVRVSVPAGVTVVATARTASWAAAESGAVSAEIVSIDAQAEHPAHTRYVETISEGGDGPDLATANIVVSGGRALASSDNFDLVYKLAKQLGAAVGASRAAVDAGYVPNELQVGQTGKIIAPDLYMCFGISGAIQHLTGIKDAGTIVAVNKDADAPIFDVADIGLVGDLFEVIPALQEKLA
ncbi:MAG: FAD-binding protein [Gammaproteobacteria bacterium]|nr:FAD-binding protein [Gammaproteobacteria bacterium]